MSVRAAVLVAVLVGCIGDQGEVAMAHMPNITRLTAMTPAALSSGSTHNYNPTDAATGRSFTLYDVIRQETNVSGSTVTGLAARDGDFLVFENLGPGTLTLAHESSSSTAANRFTLPNSTNLGLPVGAAAMLFYDSTTDRWHINATGLGLPSISDDGATVGILASAVSFTKNADGTGALHGRVTIPSAVSGKPAHTIDSYRHTFNGTGDPIVSIGYNQLASGAFLQAGEPSVLMGLEGDYNDGSVRWTEAYFQHMGSDGTTQRRPFYSKVNRSTNNAVVEVQGNPVYVIGDDRSTAMTIQPADVVVHNVLHVGEAGTTGGALQLDEGTKSARMRLSGGSQEILQIGSITGVTRVDIGPTAITGTTEIQINSTDVQFNVPITVSASGGPTIRAGAGTPEGAVAAVVGSLYLRTNGGANTTLYVKESGSGNTGWVAK